MVTISAFAVATLLAAAIAAAVTGTVWRAKYVPGSRPLTAMLAGCTLYAGAYGMGLLFSDPATSRLFELPFWLGGEVLTVGWLFFALGFTGRGEYLTRRNAALVSLVPAVTVLLVATNGAHGLFWTNYEVVSTLGAWVRVFDRGPWLYVKSAYAFVLIAAGWLIFLEDVLEAGALYRDQSVAFIVGSLVPLSAYGAWLFGLGPYPDVDFSPALIGVTGVLYGYAIFRAEMFEATPAARRMGQRAAIDGFADAVVILDSERNVTKLNDAAAALLDRSREAALGAPLDDLLPADLDPDETAQQVALETAGGWREFEVKSTRTTDGTGRTVGYTLVFHDVTERERRKQRLEVMNRVLRHNVRNRLNAVDGYAALLADRSDQEGAELAETLRDQTDQLVTLAEKARRIEGLLRARDDERAPVDVGDLLEGVVDRFAEDYPDRTIRTEVAGSPVVEADGELLGVVVRNLLENAAEHGEGTIRLSATAEDRLRIAVSDAGPGVPDHERRAVMDGEETPLEHGSGLGLWVVKWGTSRLGGQFDLADNDRGGTTASVSIPTAPAREPDGLAEPVGERAPEPADATDGRSLPGD